MTNLKTRVETITPTKAAKLLKGNTRNRTLQLRRVSALAHDMTNGQWMLTGAPIVFNGDGTLLDGQHRLMACVNADTPFETLVVRGVQHEAQAVMDHSKSRTLKDVLKIEDVKYYAVVASTTRWLYLMLRDGQAEGPARESATTPTLRRFLSEHPGIIEAVEERYLCSKPLQPQFSCGLQYIANHSEYRDEINKFLDAVHSGEGLTAHDPRLRLRNWLFEIKTRKAISAVPTNTRHRMVLKMLEAFVNGDQVKAVRLLASENYDLSWAGWGPNA